MQRAIVIFVTIILTAIGIASAFADDVAGPTVVLKVRTQIEDSHHKSQRSSTIGFSLNQDDVPQVNLGDYQIDVLISDIQAYELSLDLTLRNAIGTAINSTQVLVPIKSESGFDLSTADVSISGTISVADVIYPVQNED